MCLINRIFHVFLTVNYNFINEMNHIMKGRPYQLDSPLCRALHFESYFLIFLYIYQNQTISTVYMNDQTFGISKLNKVAIALKKKEFLHMQVI